MVFLSGLLPFTVVDEHGRRAALRDAVVDLAAGDYPPVTHLLISDPDRPRDRRAALALPWAAVTAIDRAAGRLHVADLSVAAPLDDDALARAVLLKRDVLDALVIDLASRRALRANDLQLVEEDGQLRLRAADASVWGILRRLGPGRPNAEGDRRHALRHLHDWKAIEFLRGDPRAAQAGRDYHRRIAALPPGRIANLMEEVPYLHAAELLGLLPDDTAAKTLEAMALDLQLQVVEELDDARVVRLLALMAPDIGADLIGRLDPAQAKRTIEALPAVVRGRLIELLRYPPHTVGGIMTNDVVALPASLTVREARQALAARTPVPDFVYFIYVIDDETTRTLRGVLSLRHLVVAGEDQRLEELMNAHPLTLDPLAPAQEGAQRVTDSHLAALPVVGTDGRLLGAVTVDAAVAEVAPEAWGSQAPRIFS